MCSKKRDLMPNRFFLIWIPETRRTIGNVTLETFFIFASGKQSNSTRLHEKRQLHFPRHDSVDLPQRMNIASQKAPRLVHWWHQWNNHKQKNIYLSHSFRKKLTWRLIFTQTTMRTFSADESERNRRKIMNADVWRMGVHEWMERKSCL